MSLADASALIALLDGQDPHHADAKAALEAGPILVSWGTLDEVAQVTRRAAKKAGLDGARASRLAITTILGFAQFREAPSVPLAEVAATHARHSSLSWTDAWTVVLAVRTKEPVVSFDRDLVAAVAKERRRSTASAP